LRAKYRELSKPVLGQRRSAHIEALVDDLAGAGPALAALADELLSASH